MQTDVITILLTIQIFPLYNKYLYSLDTLSPIIILCIKNCKSIVFLSLDRYQPQTYSVCSVKLSLNFMVNVVTFGVVDCRCN